jgi:hypothetical protein
VNPLSAQIPPDFLRCSSQCHGRRSRAHSQYFDIQPTHPFGPAGSQGFEEGLLGGESGGITRDGIPVSRAVLLLGGGDHALEETIPLPFEDSSQALNFDDVNSDSDNHE